MTLSVTLLHPLGLPLGWSFAEAFSPLALSEDAHTLPESLQGIFFSPPPKVQRCDSGAKQPVVWRIHRQQIELQCNTCCTGKQSKGEGKPELFHTG